MLSAFSVKSTSVLGTRETTSFGLSVGVGLSLESVFRPISKRVDDGRSAPDNVQLEKYDRFYFSLPTLALALYNAIPTSPKKKLFLLDSSSIDEMLEAITSELLIISDLFDGNICTPFLFIPDIDKVTSNSLGTDLLAGNKETLYFFMRELCKKAWKIKDELIMKVVDTRVKLPQSSLKTMIMTSYASDLLNVTYISNLELLEPHTGRVKRKNQFNTKYNKFGSNDMTILPFNEKLLYILGDKHLIPSTNIKLKKALLDTAVKHKWTPMTTNDKIIFTLKTESYDLFYLYNDLKRIYI